ncbi:alpha-L RNA-binding motif-containing protein [Xylariaceae sp. FL1019]|nr:alpha-L RNA-binding motif-containing protein [Xylariaceae sp. FL1019]
MRPRGYYNLKRGKIRQSWNKYNLYNLSKVQRPVEIGKYNAPTFFQQKWKAKGMLRSYHGEHIVERKWERMFSRRLLSVVNMDPKYMATNDGSEMAAGRGSGKDTEPKWDARSVAPKMATPYMQMTFAPMERRLDIAVFRAMFASSTRQARQFCVHGAVKVNGKVMPYPAYRLNPGDMFQVDPERVMYATGRQKELSKKEKMPSSMAQDEDAPEETAEEEVEAAAEASEDKAEQDPDTTDAPVAEPIDMKPTRKQIQDLTAQVKTILKEEKFSAKQKRGLRSFLKDAKPLLSRAGRPNASPAEIANELSTLIAELDISGGKEASVSDKFEEVDVIGDLSPSQLKELEKRMADHIREEEENPLDPSKPYMTPWRPRYFMSPFAFIPRYLEVNQNICSAVYLRHPVARQGSAEVPTPYNNEVGQLAFNWYLRRR